jgi:hypothetical protein
MDRMSRRGQDRRNSRRQNTRSRRRHCIIEGAGGNRREEEGGDGIEGARRDRIKEAGRTRKEEGWIE